MRISGSEIAPPSMFVKPIRIGVPVGGVTDPVAVVAAPAAVVSDPAAPPPVEVAAAVVALGATVVGDVAAVTVDASFLSLPQPAANAARLMSSTTTTGDRERCMRTP